MVVSLDTHDEVRFAVARSPGDLGIEANRFRSSVDYIRGSRGKCPTGVTLEAAALRCGA